MAPTLRGAAVPLLGTRLEEAGQRFRWSSKHSLDGREESACKGRYHESGECDMLGRIDEGGRATACEAAGSPAPRWKIAGRGAPRAATFRLIFVAAPVKHQRRQF